jgi:ubiquinone/menaquinone biosynthesis C-methylase UbiE
MTTKTRLAVAPLAAGPLFAAWIVQERRSPKPMKPFWSFTLQGRARVTRARQTLQEIGVRPGLNVLEIGCGPGVMLEAAVDLTGPDDTVHAVDVQQGMVERARARLDAGGIDGVDIRRADAMQLPYPDATFDLAYMVTVIGELPDPLPAVAEIKRVLAPGGVLAVTEEIFDPHYTRPPRVREICEGAGFGHIGTIGGRIQQTVRFEA